MSPKVRTCLWYDAQALPAAEFYCSLIPDSRITEVGRYPEGNDRIPEGSDGVLTVEFELAGTPYQALNGGPVFPLSEAVSISVKAEDQGETDRLWEALTADGGSESQCGWLKDRFGLSWQIVPRPALALLAGPASAKVWPALMAMRKIDIAALERVAAGN
ncbi:MAG: VOC family protein [Notoacmeibacter sp.]|nr:VOC family protein [Notoacmeibacter sp.]